MLDENQLVSLYEAALEEGHLEAAYDYLTHPCMSARRKEELMPAYHETQVRLMTKGQEMIADGVFSD